MVADNESLTEGSVSPRQQTKASEPATSQAWLTASSVLIGAVVGSEFCMNEKSVEAVLAQLPSAARSASTAMTVNRKGERLE